ncbi:MAG: DNA-formamidopyrimidine glycosylase [Candidatus Paceibacterota bacterium]|jgi:formamidopyrimidine-DNA glycosylase
MPELPEVQTTVNILNRRVKGLTILDVWTDYDSSFHKGKNNIKDRNYFPLFKKQILNKKILGVERRAKNVLINVSGNNEKPDGLVARKTILVHMKMTGHLLYGKYKFENKKWFPPAGSMLSDPYNRFIHLAFSLSDKNTLVLSDTRKFAKVFVYDTDKMSEIPDLKKLGPEPLSRIFTYKIFKERLLKKPNGKIKTVLMDQEIISGIGNIYSDEVLWMSYIHPMQKVKDISDMRLKLLFKNVIKVLNESIKVGGDSMSDYRNPLGKKGGYQNIHKVYRRTGEKCKKNDGGIIRRIKVGGRSAHYCDVHQKLN